MTRGYLHIQYTVFCGCTRPSHAGGQCVFWEYVEGKTRKAAGDSARRIGWALTRYRGWLCPTCDKDECQEQGNGQG